MELHGSRQSNHFGNFSSFFPSSKGLSGHLCNIAVFLTLLFCDMSVTVPTKFSWNEVHLTGDPVKSIFTVKPVLIICDVGQKNLFPISCTHTCTPPHTHTSH